MTKIQLAYLAGLFDGEGSFSIKISAREYKGRKSIQCGPKMTMSLRYGNGVLNELVTVFGGTIYDYSKTESMYRWNLSKHKLLVRAATMLVPFLRIKKQVAIRFLEALDLFPKKRARHGAGERSWDAATTHKVAAIAFTLNPGKSRKCKSGIESIAKLKAAIYDTDNYIPAGLPKVSYKNSTTKVFGVSKHWGKTGRVTGKFSYVAIACKGKQRLAKYFPGTPEGLKQAETQAKAFREQLRPDV